MAASLEARTPLLDHTLFEFAWTLPASSQDSRQAEANGFFAKCCTSMCRNRFWSVPKLDLQFHWMPGYQGPCVTGQKHCLNRGSERRVISTQLRFAKSGEHLTGQRNWQYPIWDVLMFQAWLEDSPKPAVVSEELPVGTQFIRNGTQIMALSRMMAECANEPVVRACGSSNTAIAVRNRTATSSPLQDVHTCLSGRGSRCRVHSQHVLRLWQRWAKPATFLASTRKLRHT